MLVYNKKGWPKTKKTQRLFKRKGHQSLTIQIKMGRHTHNIVNTQILTMLGTWTKMLTHIHSCGTVSMFYSQCEGNEVLNKHLLVTGPASCRGTRDPGLPPVAQPSGFGKPKGVRGMGRSGRGQMTHLTKSHFWNVPTFPSILSNKNPFPSFLFIWKHHCQATTNHIKGSGWAQCGNS